MSFRIAVDIGGTFTDGVIERGDGGEVLLAKRLTTHDDPGVALKGVIQDLLAAAALRFGAGRAAEQVAEVVHGNTLVTNALIERKGAVTALITTKGFADVIDIGREVRYDLYDLDIRMPPPLVEAGRRFELDERVAADASVLKHVVESEVEALVPQLRASGAESVAVAFLHSYANPDNETAVAAVLKRVAPELRISLSSRVAREIREYERTTTTTANAFVQPLVESYLGELESRLAGEGISADLRIMISNGGTTSAAAAAEVPIAMLESGPAGGVISAANAGMASGFPDVLAFDMGGTTAKLCTVIDGQPAIAHMFEAGRVHRFKKGSGLPLIVPSIDLIEIGAGGGSIARMNELEMMTVGPQSAGSEPGPACYGLGGEQPTVTDADLLLGYLNPAFFLGGRMTLDRDAAQAAMARLGERLGLPAHDIAKGIFNVVNEAMAGAARVHIAEKAFDPRRFTMVATGGAGPVHAVEIARKLSIGAVLFPIAAGAGSCLGFLAAPIRADRSWSKPMRLADVSLAEASAALASLKGEVEAELQGTAAANARVEWSIVVEMRYSGQGSNLSVPLPFMDLPSDFHAELANAFQRQYETVYGGVLPAGHLEVVTWRVTGATQKAVRNFAWPAGSFAAAAEPSPVATRTIFCTTLDEMREAPVYRRYELRPGTVLNGPLIVEEEESTIVVPVPAEVRILDNLSLLVRLEA